MQLHLSPSMRSITISSSNSGSNSSNGKVAGLMKIKVAARRFSYGTLFQIILLLAVLLPFVFILTAIGTLEGCLSRPWGPSFLGRAVDSERLVRDFYMILNDVNNAAIPVDLELPDSFNQLVTDMKSNNYDARTFALVLRAMMVKFEHTTRKSKLAEVMNKHFAATSIPKGIHCLSLLLTDEYSSNANARKPLPPPELLPLLVDKSYHHYVLPTDNVLAASVVVCSGIQSSKNPERMVFHVITDKKTYAAMHSWFALHPTSPAVVEVKSIHQFDSLAKENIPVLDAVENQDGIRNHYHGNQITGVNLDDITPRMFASKLLTRSPKYISLLNHLRIYLPEVIKFWRMISVANSLVTVNGHLFPDLDKVLFLDDDVVIQRDLSSLWEIDLGGKVNGAVETCRGDDGWVMSKRFRYYFNFSNPLIAKALDPDECPWAYGMNIFDLCAWRNTDIKETYHFWVNENLKSNLSMWKLGTLPPALIAFKGHVHPIDPSWHMLGLGYQNNTNIDNVNRAAVIHYNGQAKPWLQIGFEHLRPFWTKYVNYSNDFIRHCHISES